MVLSALPFPVDTDVREKSVLVLPEAITMLRLRKRTDTARVSFGLVVDAMSNR